jgi:hypothetical protein
VSLSATSNTGSELETLLSADEHMSDQHVNDLDDIPWSPTAYPDRVAELEAELAAAQVENAQLIGRNEDLCRELTRLQDECPLDVLRRVYGDDEHDVGGHGGVDDRHHVGDRHDDADDAKRDDRRDGHRSIDVRGPGWRGWTNFR